MDTACHLVVRHARMHFRMHFRMHLCVYKLLEVPVVHFVVIYCHRTNTCTNAFVSYRFLCFTTGSAYYPIPDVAWGMKNGSGIMKGITTNLSDVHAAYSDRDFEQNFITFKRRQSTPHGESDINVMVMFSATINT